MFFANLNVNAYWAKTHTNDLAGKDPSYRGQLDYTGDRYGVQIERLVVGEGFNPEIGFVRRTDITSSHAQFRFSPRPRERFEAVRKFTYSGFFKQIEDGKRTPGLARRTSRAQHRIPQRRSFPRERDELLRIPAGGLPDRGRRDAAGRRLRFLDIQNRLQPRPEAEDLRHFSVERGTFYNGHKTSVTLSRGRIKFSTRLSGEPTYALNKVELLEGSFTNHLLGTRATYSIAPLMFVSALIQYNSARKAMSSNVRLRWEYRPGSELFVVYNEERDTRPSGFPMMKNKALVVKTNRLFRF